MTLAAAVHTNEVLEIKQYVDRLEFLIAVCIGLLVLGVVGIFFLIFGFNDEEVER